MGRLLCQRCQWREPNHTTPFHSCSFEAFKQYEKRIRLWDRGFYDSEKGPRYTDEEVNALMSDDQIPSFYDMKHACSGACALCEPCWKKLTPIQRLYWHRELFKLWVPADEDTESRILRASASVLNGY